MQMQHGIAFLIRKQCSGTDDLMHVIQDVLHWNRRQFTWVLRTDNEFAVFIGASDDDQRCGFYGLVASKLFYFLMNNIPIFKADNLDPSRLTLRKFHD